MVLWEINILSALKELNSITGNRENYLRKFIEFRGEGFDIL